MKLLLLKESNKNARTLLIPSDVKKLVSNGIQVYFESNVGLNSNITDEEYTHAGANLVKKYKQNITSYDVICKVGKIKNGLLKLLEPNQIIWSYSNPINETKFLFQLIKNKNTLISLKSIDKFEENSFFDVSEKLKGKFSIYLAGYYLSKINKNGLGKLLGKVNNANSTVFVVGGTTIAGQNAIKTALGFGSDVIAFDYSDEVVDQLRTDKTYSDLSRANGCIFSVFKYEFEKLFTMLKQADVVISCADNPDEPTHSIFNEKMISTMRKGTVFINLSSDYGFASETERKVTSVNKSIFTSAGIIHFNTLDVSKYYPSTFSTLISEVNTKYLLELKKTFTNIAKSEVLNPAIITFNGKLTNKDIANSLNLEYTNIKEIK